MKKLIIFFIVCLIPWIGFSAKIPLVKIPVNSENGLRLYKELDQKKETLSPDEKKQYALLRLNFFEELGGDRETNDKTIEIVENFSEETPEDLFLSVVLNASRCRTANDYSSVGRKMLIVRKCILQLNKAVKKAPEDPNLRIVRGNTFMALPKIFKKQKKALEDWEKIWELSKDYPELKPMAAYKIGFLLKKESPQKSKEYFQKAAESSDKYWGNLAKQEI